MLECRDLFIVMLNVIILSVVMLNVIMLSVVKLNVIMLSVVAPAIALLELSITLLERCSKLWHHFYNRNDDHDMFIVQARLDYFASISVMNKKKVL
jgi:hypothetical protein